MGDSRHHDNGAAVVGLFFASQKARYVLIVSFRILGKGQPTLPITPSVLSNHVLSFLAQGPQRLWSWIIYIFWRRARALGADHYIKERV